MSEHAYSFVEVSLTASEAQAHGPVVRAWLQEHEFVVPNRERDPVFHPSEFRAGPRFPDVGGWNSGVDVQVSRTVYHAVENYEPPCCPACGEVALDEDAHHALIEPWLAGPEPVVCCVACGRSTMAGDLVGRWSFHVGELGVVFHNWPPFEEELVGVLSAVLGPRCRMVVDHT